MSSIWRRRKRRDALGTRTYNYYKGGGEDTIISTDGSKLLGSGSFGCVYYPGKACSNKLKLSDNRSYVTKILSNKDGNNEYKTYTQLNLDAIDPDQFFYIHNVEICTLLRETRDRCTRDTFGNDPMIALNYLFGGQSLDDYWESSKSRYPGVQDDSKYKFRVLFMCEVLLGMPGALSGLEFLFKHGVIHNDISFANLMMDEKGLIRIIDFGAAIKYSTATVKEAQENIENPDTGGKYRRFLPDLLCIFSDYKSNEMTKETLKVYVMRNNLSWLENILKRKSVKDSTFTILDRFDTHCNKEIYLEMDAWMSSIIENTDAVQNTIRKKGGAENLRFLNSVTETYFEFADTFSLATGMISRVSSLKFVGAAFETFGSGEAQDFLTGVYSFFLAMVSPNMTKRLGIRLAYNEYTKTFYRSWNARLSEIVETARRQPEPEPVFASKRFRLL